MPEVDKDILLSRFMTPSGLELLVGSGAELIKQIGLDVIRGIIFDILTGKNIRDSTEALTRSRISALNMAIFWPQQVARLLKKSLGFEHELVDMKQSQIEEYLKARLNDVPLESFIGNLPARNVDDVQGTPLEEQVLEEEQEDL